MMNLNFLQVSFKKLQRSFKILLAFIFFLNDCKNHNGCGLSTSAAYMQVLTALFADLLSLGKCYEAYGLSWIFGSSMLLIWKNSGHLYLERNSR